MPLQHYPEIETILSWILSGDLTGKRILDVGCGMGAVGYLVRRLRGGDGAYLVGVEGWPPYADFARRFNIYDELIVCWLEEYYLPYTFDVVLAVEVLEHLDKGSALELLTRLERACTGTLIVTTPNGPDLRGAIDGVPLEAHRSSWTTREFRSRGYKVRGMGFRWSRKEHVRNRIGLALWYAMTPLSLRWPQLADCLIAVREQTP